MELGNESKRAVALWTDFMATFFLFGVEITRFQNINTVGISKYASEHPEWQAPEISQPWLAVLQSCGDIMPGFLASIVTYWAIDGIDMAFKKEIPNNVKVAISTLVGISAIVAHETGLIGVQGYSTGTLPDVLVGAVGPIAFAGLHTLLDKFIEDSGKKIAELEMEVDEQINIVGQDVI